MPLKQSRSDFSLQRLDELQQEISAIKELRNDDNLCIYTTGSYGRLEAGIFSDIDLFFLARKRSDISKITKVIIDARIIEMCRKMSLPEFSGDGEYLEVHTIDGILAELGSRKDDYLNYFTARMLLLLESKPLHNDLLYTKTISDILGRYYKDFEDHAKEFQPVFLVNDIIRFWRTICLNYEYSRTRNIGTKESKVAVRRRKIKASIKNLKLKFSRKLTCYSLLLCLLWGKKPTKAEAFRLINLTPMQRLQELKNFSEISDRVEELTRLYDWFLTTVQQETYDLTNWISKRANKELAFDKADRFGEIIVEIMLRTPNATRLRYFLV